MDKNEVREFILGQLEEKLRIFDISRDEVRDSFDIVGSGLLDSMAFVDLVTATEEHFNIEIDFEKAADTDNFTRMGGLVDLIINA